MADQRADRRAQAGVGGHAGIGVRAADCRARVISLAGQVSRTAYWPQHVLDQAGAPIDGRPRRFWMFMVWLSPRFRP